MLFFCAPGVSLSTVAAACGASSAARRIAATKYSVGVEEVEEEEEGEEETPDSAS